MADYIGVTVVEKVGKVLCYFFLKREGIDDVSVKRECKFNAIYRGYYGLCSLDDGYIVAFA